MRVQLVKLNKVLLLCLLLLIFLPENILAISCQSTISQLRLSYCDSIFKKRDQIAFFNYNGSVGNVDFVTKSRLARSFYETSQRLKRRLLTSPSGEVLDASGNRTTMVDTEGTTQYQYDNLSRLVQADYNGQVGDCDISIRSRVTGRSSQAPKRSKLGLLTEPLGRSDGTYEKFTMDIEGRRTQHEDNGSVGYVDMSIKSRLTHKSTQRNVRSKRRLLTSPSGEVDGTTNYHYDIGDRLLSTTGAKPSTSTFDLNGNLVTKETPDGTVNYFYSARDRQKEVILPNGDTNFYSYYPESDLRFSTLDANNVEKKYFYEGSNVVEELNQYNTTIASYLEGLGVDQHIAKVVNGNVYAYVTDPLGTVRNIVDGSGQIVNDYTYKAYGDSRRRIEAVDNAYLFTGRRFDNDTGSYYYRARYYDPLTGMFGGVDRYAPDEMTFGYAAMNPMLFIDPFGLKSLLLINNLESWEIKKHPKSEYTKALKLFETAGWKIKAFKTDGDISSENFVKRLHNRINNFKPDLLIIVGHGGTPKEHQNRPNLSWTKNGWIPWFALDDEVQFLYPSQLIPKIDDLKPDEDKIKWPKEVILQSCYSAATEDFADLFGGDLLGFKGETNLDASTEFIAKILKLIAGGKTLSEAASINFPQNRGKTEQWLKKESMGENLNCPRFICK